MGHIKFCRWNVSGALVVLASLLAWPAGGVAQTVTGQAAAVQATVFSLLGGTTTLGLANTGSLSGPTDDLEASQLTGNLLGALTAEVPSATTIGYPDQVDSATSLANLTLTVGGTTISADSILEPGTALLGVTGRGNALHANL